MCLFLLRWKKGVILCPHPLLLPPSIHPSICLLLTTILNWIHRQHVARQELEWRSMQGIIYTMYIFNSNEYMKHPTGMTITIIMVVVVYRHVIVTSISPVISVASPFVAVLDNLIGSSWGRHGVTWRWALARNVYLTASLVIWYLLRARNVTVTLGRLSLGIWMLFYTQLYTWGIQQRGGR